MDGHRIIMQIRAFYELRGSDKQRDAAAFQMYEYNGPGAWASAT